MKLYFNDIYYCCSYCTNVTIASEMLQGALVKFDKTVLLRKNCYRNGLIMLIVVHEMRRQKQIWTADKTIFYDL